MAFAPRAKNILEQLSRTWFFTAFEIRALFSAATEQGKKGGIFKLRKKSYSGKLF